jgi:WD40 repeat protein
MRLGVCGDFKFRGDNVVIPRLTEPLILSKDRLRKIHYSNLLDPNRLAIETDSDVEFLNYRNRVSLQKFNSAAVGRFINMSRDGRVAAFSKNEYIDVYDVDKGKFQFRPAAGQLAELFGDGSLVIVADDKQLSVYNLQHPQFFSTGHDGLIGFALSSDPDGYYVATCDTESIRLFDHFRKERFKRNFSIDHASCLAFGGNERLFAVGKLPSLKTWEVPSGRALATTELTPHHQNPISAIGVSPDGRRIVTGDIAGQVQLWAVQPNAAAVWLKKLSTDVQNDAGNRIASSIPINKLAFLDNKHVVAVCKAASPDQPGCIFRWNLDSPEEAERDEYEALSVAKADSNSDMIAAGTTTGRLHLKPSTPVPFDTEITFEDEPIIDLAFHPHQPRLAILSARDLRLLDTERGDQVLSVRCPLTAPSQIEFTPDGNGIVVSDSQRGDLWLLRAVPE